MRQIRVYTIQELQDEFPDAYQRVYKRYQDSIDEIHWAEEIIDSLKKLFEWAGLKLTDYSIGAYSYSYVRFNFPFLLGLTYYGDKVYNLVGARAMAWLENNLFKYLRIPYDSNSIPYLGNRFNRNNVRKYGKSYYPGKIPPCPLTGVCFDDDFLNRLQENVISGMCLGDSFADLADCARELLEEELDYSQSEECFLLATEGLFYTKDGNQV